MVVIGVNTVQDELVHVTDSPEVPLTVKVHEPCPLQDPLEDPQVPYVGKLD